MFSVFRKRTQPKTPVPDASALAPRRMNLEERKAFRRDVVEHVAREFLEGLGAEATAYRLRIMPLDARQHRFIVVVDVPPDFEPRRAGQRCDLAAVEAELRRDSYERYGVVIEGIYWRHELEQPAAGRHRGQTGSGVLRGFEANPWQLVSDEEKEALMEAIRLGAERPVLHVGDLEYHTDMAPLSGHTPAKKGDKPV